ncbi:uncharacterized protein LOC117191408 [Drosophila miranda]|uniref:uncharacterized protein LOC117191408 n=1 Tax=Drosophila miranda TaxID=7229 RepID=UPI00143F2390|nr:uncharacterized protein LOC117191408 [Drosophila miranda]
MGHKLDLDHGLRPHLSIVFPSRNPGVCLKRPRKKPRGGFGVRKVHSPVAFKKAACVLPLQKDNDSHSDSERMWTWIRMRMRMRRAPWAGTQKQKPESPPAGWRVAYSQQ